MAPNLINAMGIYFADTGCALLNGDTVAPEVPCGARAAGAPEAQIWPKLEALSSINFQILPYVMQLCFRAANQSSGPDLGWILVGKS